MVICLDPFNLLRYEVNKRIIRMKNKIIGIIVILLWIPSMVWSAQANTSPKQSAKHSVVHSTHAKHKKKLHKKISHKPSRKVKKLHKRIDPALAAALKEPIEPPSEKTSISQFPFVSSIEHQLVEFVHKTVDTVRYSAYKLGGRHFDTSRGIYILDCSDYVDNILKPCIQKRIGVCRCDRL